jgi:hypothetical protein
MLKLHPLFMLMFVCVLTTGASAAERHWRKRNQIPELPYPELLNPGQSNYLPLRGVRRRSGTPALPYPEILRPQDDLPLASGFVMTVTKSDRDNRDNRYALSRPRDVAERIASCWNPPRSDAKEDREVTLRLQFSRNGTVIGKPQVTYVQPGSGQGARSVLIQSIETAIHDCTPLQFTGSLGPAIAGYPFAIRFIAAGKQS